MLKGMWRKKKAEYTEIMAQNSQLEEENQRLRSQCLALQASVDELQQRDKSGVVRASAGVPQSSSFSSPKLHMILVYTHVR